MLLLCYFDAAADVGIMKGTPKVVLRKGRLMQPMEGVNC